MKDPKIDMKWVYTWDVDSAERDAIRMKVFSGGRFSYEMFYPYCDVQAVIRNNASPEFWDWLPDQG